MRPIFDFIKDTLRKIDGYWIENAGHPIIVKGFFKHDPSVHKLYFEHKGVYESITPTLVYGFYDYPKTTTHLNMFSIDAPEELVIQFNAEILVSKLGKIPLMGTLLNIEGSNWLVINRSWIYNRFIGKYRIELRCQQYQESMTTGKNGIQMQSSSKNTVSDEE